MKCESTYTGPKGGEWKVLNTRSSIAWTALNSQAKDECNKRLEKAAMKAVMKKAKAASKVAEEKKATGPVPAKK